MSVWMVKAPAAFFGSVIASARSPCRTWRQRP